MRTALFLVSFFIASLGMGAMWALVLPDPTLIEIEVIDQSDPALTDRITHLQLLVRNVGDWDLAPVFFVPGGALMNWIVWDQQDGAPIIPAGNEETIVITTPPYTGIPFGADFRVLAFDGDGRRLGGTQLVPFDVDATRPSALNPAFQYWQPQMFTRDPMPYGWVPLDRTLRESSWQIVGEDGNLTMRLWPDSDRRMNSTLVVRQAIDFPMHLRIDTDPSMLRVDGDRAVAAILIEDVYAERRIDVQLLPPGQRPLPIESGIDDAGEWLRIQTNASTIDLDVPDLFDQMGWAWPAKRTLERTETVGPGNIGFGAAATLAGAQRLEIMRPIELELLLVSKPPHPMEMLQVSFSNVGGPALDPSPSRF